MVYKEKNDLGMAVDTCRDLLCPVSTVLARTKKFFPFFLFSMCSWPCIRRICTDFLSCSQEEEIVASVASLIDER